MVLARLLRPYSINLAKKFSDFERKSIELSKDIDWVYKEIHWFHKDDLRKSIEFDHKNHWILKGNPSNLLRKSKEIHRPIRQGSFWIFQRSPLNLPRASYWFWKGFYWIGSGNLKQIIDFSKKDLWIWWISWHDQYFHWRNQWICFWNLWMFLAKLDLFLPESIQWCSFSVSHGSP